MNDASEFSIKRLLMSHCGDVIKVIDSEKDFKIAETNENYSYLIDFNSILEGNFEDYIIIKYGTDHAKTEESIFKNIKGGQSKNQKSDVSFIIYNKNTKEISFIIGEIKDTINSGRFNKARRQIVSSLLDALMLNSLFTLNKIPEKEKIFLLVFYINEENIRNNSIPKSSTTKHMGSSIKTEIKEGRRFTNYEWQRKKIAYSVENFNTTNLECVDEFFKSKIQTKEELNLICCQCECVDDLYSPVLESLNQITI